MNSDFYDAGVVRRIPLRNVHGQGHPYSVCAKIIRKNSVRPYHNGGGCLLKLVIKDESGVSANTTIFSDTDLTDVHSQLKEDHVYHFSKWSSKPAQPQYNQGSHPYELTMHSRDGVITAASDSHMNVEVVPPVERRWSLKAVAEDAYPQQLLSLRICRLLRIGSIFEGTSRAGNPYRKKDVLIGDAEGHAIKLTLWGNTIARYSLEGWLNSLLDIRVVKLNEYEGRLSLGSVDDTYLAVWGEGESEEVPATQDTKWKDISLSTTSRRDRGNAFPEISFQAADQASLARLENTSDRRFQVQAVLQKLLPVKSNGTLYYDSCASCKKGVRLDDSSGQLHCGSEGCPATEHARHFYIFELSVADRSQPASLTCYDTIGQQLLGVSAEELHQATLNMTPEERDAHYVCLYEQRGLIDTQFTFRIKAELRLFNGEQRSTYDVVGVDGDVLGPPPSELLMGVECVPYVPAARAGSSSHAEQEISVQPGSSSVTPQLDYTELDVDFSAYDSE